MKLPISKFTVYGSSMVPSLQPGQDILSLNWFYKPEVGDTVIIKQDGREMVKRVTKIDGRQILVRGDNTEESTDSRHFGPINVDQIVGKVIYRSGEMSCPQCESPVIGIYGRKDAICQNCGFKLSCCGEP